jgi:glycosyltransferase involved in cell wall biosynthesis
MRVWYYGNYYTERQRRERGLLARNVAGVNRMRRVARALRAVGVAVQIISPGTCARCQFSPRIVHAGFCEESDGLDVTALPALGIPWLSSVFELIFVAAWFVRRGICAPPDAMLLYNFSPSCVVFALLARLRGITVISQIEDVSVPRLSDWQTGSETRPIQQLIFYPCMKAVVWLAHGVVVPTGQFKAIVPSGKRCEVVTGCMEDHELRSVPAWPLDDNRPLEVLFLGKYETEHGLDLVVDTLHRLRERPELAKRFRFHCCGTDRFPKELVDLARDNGRSPEVRLHGFLSRQQYESLLDQVHVGLVLQRGQGRYGNYKTPSKGYELMAAGKLVVATDVGDFASLAPSFLVCLREESATALVEVLAAICADSPRYEQIACAARAFSATQFRLDAVGNVLVRFFESVAGKAPEA